METKIPTLSPYTPNWESLEKQLLDYKIPITEIDIEDIEKLGWKYTDYESNYPEGRNYRINKYIKDNKELVFVRVQTDAISAASWLLREDEKVKQLVHTKEELENISK